jgi:hypothetical protein
MKTASRPPCPVALLLITAITTAIHAHDSDYVISKITVSGNIQPYRTTDFMTSFPGNGQLLPDTTGILQPHTFYLRNRNKQSLAPDYQVYTGQVDSSKCYSGLSFFQVDGSVSSRRLLLKYYRSEDPDIYDDLKEVYFQDGYVLAPELHLYYRQPGRMVAAKRLDSPPMGCLSIHSSPEKSKIFLNGKPVGTTPVFLAGLKTGLVQVLLSDSGYQTVFAEPNVIPETTLTRSYELSPVIRITAEGPDRKALLNDDAKTPEAIGSRENLLHGFLDSLARLRDSAVARFDGHYPAFEENPRETGLLRNARHAAHTRQRDSLRLAISAPFDSVIHFYQPVVNELRAKRERLECETVSLELPGDKIQLLEYDPNLRMLPFQVDISANKIASTFIGSFRLSPQENITLRSRLNKARVLMDYRRIPTKGHNNRIHYFTLENFRVNLDTLLALDTLASGFYYDRNFWNASDSLSMEGRIRACRTEPMQWVRKSFWTPMHKVLAITGGAALALWVGGTLCWMTQDQPPQKETVYAIPVDGN